MDLMTQRIESHIDVSPLTFKVNHCPEIFLALPNEIDATASENFIFPLGVLT